MDTNKNIYQRIAQVKKAIVNTATHKDGKNKSIGYAYFTPETVIPIATNHCDDAGLVTNFQLLQDEFGYYGELTITNIETPTEQIKVVHRTAIPEGNRAMNASQLHGSCSSYSHRYLLQHTFGLVDNSLDPDNDKKSESNSNKPKPENSVTPSNSNGHKPQAENNKPITEGQIKRLFAIAKENDISNDRVKKLVSLYGLESVKDIPMSKYDEIINRLETANSKQ